MRKEEEKCLCHSGKAYDVCCKPFHEGKNALTAVELMRSRYSAYAMGNVEYIVETTHPNHVDRKKSREALREDIQKFCKNTRFLGLEILAYEEKNDTSFVIFRATLEQGGRDASFTEKSFFEKMEGKWLYEKGILL